MDFAGNKYIYLPKLKKDKIKKIRKEEEDNKGEAPILKPIQPIAGMTSNNDDLSKKLNQYKNKDELEKEKDDLSIDSDDGYIQVNSNDFNIDLVNSQLNNPMNQQAAPGLVFKNAVDTNVCVIRFKELENESEIIPKLYKCQICGAYLNKYSTLNPVPGKDIYNWKCEFCSNINNNLFIEQQNIPKNDSIDNCILPKLEKETNKDDDSSLIFCFDISGSMCQSYNIGSELKEKFNKIIGKKSAKQSLFSTYSDYADDNIDFTNFDFNQNNTSYISRLDMVKLSIENNINSLLKNSPNIKVGIVSFGSNIEVKGDCLSNVFIVKEKDMDNESKIISLGEENTNLIKAPINQSSPSIIKSLRATEENGSTALGPAILLSLSLLKNAKIGSRIFLCTDGLSNLGVGDISQNREKAIEFYKKIGNMAKDKGVVISLITFEDSESEINILKNMVELSGGEIIRVNPNEILDGFNDLLENEAIASEVESQINLNKCMTFRDINKKDLINNGSSIIKKIGNVTKETENYYELKFKHAIQLAEMIDINFDELKNLIFQTVITYKRKNGGKYIRVITKSLEVSDNKEIINKQANLNIVSVLQIQKSAKMANEGKFMHAQAQIHIARNFLNNNIDYNYNNNNIYNQFNNNINSFHNNLNMMNMNMNSMNNNMMNNMNMNNMNNNNMNNNMMMNNMNNNMMMNNMNNNMMNNNMMMNSNMMNNMNMNMNNMNQMMMNNMNMNNDLLSGQIFALSNTSENRQNMQFNRMNRINYK